MKRAAALFITVLLCVSMMAGCSEPRSENAYTYDHMTIELPEGFTVDESGSVKDISIINTPDRLLSAEAIRVVSNSPKWSPGEKDNEKVSVTYTFPVVFQLL